MADTDTSPQEPQEVTDTVEQTTEQQKDDTEVTEPEQTEAATWDEFLASLPEDQRTRVKGELDRREKDTRKARNEARNLRERVNKAEPKAAEHDEAVEAQKTAEQKADDLNTTLRSDNEGLRKRLVTQEIRVQAADRFADPDDPVGFLDSTELLDTDLEPDKQAIGDALDDLLARKPHLGKPDPKPRPPAPTKAQGSSANGTPTVESQIAQARKAGDHDEAIRLEMAKLDVSTPK